MRLWSLIFVLILATGLGVVIRKDPGYALFAYQDWTIEMPLWVAAILLLIIATIAVFLLWLVNMLFSSTGKIKNAWIQHKQRHARLQTTRGLLALVEGRFKDAERLLIKSAHYNDSPVINYLSAAKAAEGNGNVEKRDQYLQLAHAANHDANIALRITEAELQFKEGEFEKSIATLQYLHAEKPKQPQAVKLLARIYESIGDWQSLYHLLPDINKAKVFQNKLAYVNFEKKVYRAMLPIVAPNGRKALIRFWQSAPYSVHKDTACIYDYANQLNHVGGQEEAESLLRTMLKNNFSEDLCKLYGMIQSPTLKKQLTFAEKLLNNDTIDNPALLFTLGRLSFYNQLWGKARDYLEKVIILSPSPEAYALLGQVMEEMGQFQKRDKYFREGLLCAMRHEENKTLHPEHNTSTSLTALEDFA